MRVLALDLGTKRVGVAVSDTTASLAGPLTTVARSGDPAQDHRAIARLVADEEATLVVVGLPLNMDGSRGPAARAAEAEAAALAAVLPVPIELSDERLTTVVADRALTGLGKRAPARRRVVDRTAAAVLLQGWLDGPGGRRLRAGDGPTGDRSGSVPG
ncbi:MAG TPA: Holliday junction resolvase RuvX [Acidimicrobiales bacterium]